MNKPLNNMTRMSVYRGRFSHSRAEISQIGVSHDGEALAVDFRVKRGIGYNDSLGVFYLHEEDLIAGLEMLRKQREKQ